MRSRDWDVGGDEIDGGGGTVGFWRRGRRGLCGRGVLMHEGAGGGASIEEKLGQENDDRQVKAAAVLCCCFCCYSGREFFLVLFLYVLVACLA